MRETEVLFFLIVVIMIRSRKTGNVSMINYLTSGFMYAKCANLILFFMSDPRLGLVYSLLFLLQGLLLPEPTYKGPENIVYFRDNNITEELNRDKNVVWMVTFYAAWSPACIDFASIFSKLSSDYGLPNLKFGKVSAPPLFKNSSLQCVSKQFRWTWVDSLTSLRSTTSTPARCPDNCPL